MLGVFGDVGDDLGGRCGNKQHDAHEGDVHHAEGVGLERGRLVIHELKQHAVGSDIEVATVQGQVRRAFEGGFLACYHVMVKAACQWRVVKPQGVAELELILRANVQLAANVFEVLRCEPRAAGAVGD